MKRMLFIVMVVAVAFAAAFVPVAWAGGGELDKEGFFPEVVREYEYVRGLTVDVSRGPDGRVDRLAVHYPIPRAKVATRHCCALVSIVPGLDGGVGLIWKIADIPSGFRISSADRTEEFYVPRIRVESERMDVIPEEGTTAIGGIVRLVASGGRGSGFDFIGVPSSVWFDWHTEPDGRLQIDALVLVLWPDSTVLLPPLPPPSVPDGRG